MAPFGIACALLLARVGGLGDDRAHLKPQQDATAPTTPQQDAAAPADAETNGTARLAAFAAACGAADFAPVVRLPPRGQYVVRNFSFGVDGARGGWDCAPRRWLRRPATQRCAVWDVGRYNERRQNMYTTEMFEDASKSIDGYEGVRDVHIGLDVGGPPGTPVYAPADGVVHSFGYNEEPGDYGHVVVTEHEIGGVRAWFLFGHLDAASCAWKRVGAAVRRGDRVGAIGAWRENGHWPSHVHFQISLAEPATHDMPGVVSLASRERALLDYPDPRLVAGPLY